LSRTLICNFVFNPVEISILLDLKTMVK